MPLRIGALVLLLVACGRIGFESRLDASARDYASVILADRPVGYWRLGERQGTIAYDSSGNHIDGSYLGGFALGAPGALANDPDTAITLDGATGFVRIPHDARIDVTNSVTSAEGWVRGGTATSQEVFSAWQVGSGFQLVYNSGVVEAWTDHGVAVSTATITDSAWHHVATVWDGTSAFVYVDGMVTGSAASMFTANALENQIGAQCTGAGSTSCGLFRTGDVDEVAVYDYPLAAANVLMHYHAGLGIYP
jgi:hypothetical protein